MTEIGVTKVLKGRPFFKSVPSTASMSRSMVQIKVNCKTQLTGIVSAILLTMILLSISFVFEPLPKVSNEKASIDYKRYLKYYE